MVNEKREIYLLKLLEQTYECISMAINVELEYADYDKVEDLKVLRRKVEKELGINPDG